MQVPGNASRTARHCAEPLPRPAQAAMCWTLTVILAAMALFAPRFVSAVATTAVAAQFPSVTFYTDNTDFLEGHTRTQQPTYAIQAHVIYGFKSGVWVAGHGTYFAGGRTSRDGVPDDDRQSNSRAGDTVALPVDRSNSVKFYASTGVSTRSGTGFNTFGVARQYWWGGG